MKAARQSKLGRKLKSRNKGWWYRSGRGWFATNDKTGKQSRLTDERGVPLFEKSQTKAVLEAAHERWKLAQADEEARKPNGMETIMSTICHDFLKRVKKECRPNTFKMWADVLFSFCTGLRPAMRERYESGDMTAVEITAARLEAKRICEDGGGEYFGGFGALKVNDLKVHHITSFVNQNPGWKTDSSKRVAKGAIKQALTYAKKQGIIEENPLADEPIGKNGKRLTEFTIEQEEAVYDHAAKAYADLFRFCLLSGARSGEYACLEKRHIEFGKDDKGEYLKATLAPHEHKTGSRTGDDRIIICSDPVVIATVKEACEANPTGKLFHTSRGAVWTSTKSAGAWIHTLKSIERETDIDMTCKGKPNSTHTCRHTFAKRALDRGVSVYTVAELLGDTPEMVNRIYGRSVKGTKQHVEKLLANR
jgi:integrase